MKDQDQESGQALIELIIFLPLLFTLYTVISGFANAINGSINQQKVTRAYFYYRVQNNSTIPKPDPSPAPYESWSRFGMFFIGWKLEFQNGEQPVMPCYRISIPLASAPTDKCEDQYTDTNTLFIRVGTVYGMCGATFVNLNRSTYFAPDATGMSFREVVDPGSCLIQ
ncbi:hypothetical protein [Peredibacter starrii]|uniref:Pilus assembly protein n=1 Tax=Peredibacter starrii TaxID=28202 RepID=A0AAX4HQS2_9BACT|nr:hypothetical protein [Peredibacter starrii]WPU65591.1 hypothetical protein SOO65_02405 [Peredibacter starrii]